VDLIHQNLETFVHDLVDFFRIELLGHGRIVGHVGEENRYQLPLPFHGASVRKDFLGKKFGGVGLRLAKVDRRGFLRAVKTMTALVAELAARSVMGATRRANVAKLMTTLTAKSRAFPILKLAFWALH